MDRAGVVLCLLGTMTIARGYTLLEAAQVVEGKCLHEGKEMDHGAIVRSSDPCEAYRCDAHKKMMLFDLCHYGRYQKAPPGCVLQKRSGDFPACCPWPDCSGATRVQDKGLSPANLTLRVRDASDVIVSASERDDAGGTNESSSSAAPASDSEAAAAPEMNPSGATKSADPSAQREAATL